MPYVFRCSAGYRRLPVIGHVLALTAGFGLAGCSEAEDESVVPPPEPTYVYLDSVDGIAYLPVQDLDAGTPSEVDDPDGDTGLTGPSPGLESRAMLFAVSDGCYSPDCSALADGSCTLTEIEPGRFTISAFFKIDTSFGTEYDRRGNALSRGCSGICLRFTTPCGEIDINQRPLEITSDDGEVFTIPVPIEVPRMIPGLIFSSVHD
jgi:hypothetical protein